MSLKTVHLVFVTVLTALAFGLCVWKARDYAEARATGDLLFALGAFFAGCLVVWYGRKVYKKLKQISYI